MFTEADESRQDNKDNDGNENVGGLDLVLVADFFQRSESLQVVVDVLTHRCEYLQHSICHSYRFLYY